MNKVFYDLHVHSCLSPCASDDMTPFNIAGMALLKELNVLALTDHNSTDNCPAFFEACNNYGIVPIAGAEVTTSEDIHVLTLFESLEAGMEFGDFLRTKRTLIENSPDIFGNQFIIDSSDTVVGEDKYLLINAVDISIDDIFEITTKYSGIAVPAHIDKASNSVVSVLGTVPDNSFTAFEFAHLSDKERYVDEFKTLVNKRYISNSDAHNLWDINEKINSFDAFSDLSDAIGITRDLFAFLRGEE